MVMYETSSENFSLICYFVQRLQVFGVDTTNKYAQLILNFFWVVYISLNHFILLILIIDVLWYDTIEEN